MEKLPKINVIYEDNHIIVVEKPINIPSQEDNTKDIDMITLIKNYLKIKYQKPNNVYLGLVHRLDRPVGGIMVFAKTSKAASRLVSEIKNNKIKKTYYAVIHGKINSKGHLEDYLYKDSKTNTSYVTDKNKGKLAILDYELIGYKNNLSLIKINLITGRSHQIRVQFSSRGYPLVGDQKYNKNPMKNVNIALFAKKLELIHPTKKEYLSFELNLPNRYPFNLFKQEK